MQADTCFGNLLASGKVMEFCRSEALANWQSTLTSATTLETNFAFVLGAWSRQILTPNQIWPVFFCFWWRTWARSIASSAVYKFRHRIMHVSSRKPCFQWRLWAFFELERKTVSRGIFEKESCTCWNSFRNCAKPPCREKACCQHLMKGLIQSHRRGVTMELSCQNMPGQRYFTCQGRRFFYLSDWKHGLSFK